MNSEEFYSTRDLNVYNTPLEVGLRVLTILNELKHEAIDINRLIIYDYFVLHGNDFDVRIESLHPPTPHRSGEIIIKRKVIQDGINLMYSRELLDTRYTEEGIYYKANELTPAFLNYFDSLYYTEISKNTKLVIRKFNSYSDGDLDSYVNDRLTKWGSEFTKESLIRGWSSE
ncbi:ABC-three component system middle component 2 [Cytobacillus sp. FSL W7-1323]|uniref:ABC-three component system middle component 2 n=1 Tax=Cytobacillus sp. FSL W7-1323 TaxID=2921700 RepID=UPI003158B133